MSDFSNLTEAEKAELVDLVIAQMAATSKVAFKPIDMDNLEHLDETGDWPAEIVQLKPGNAVSAGAPDPANNKGTFNWPLQDLAKRTAILKALAEAKMDSEDGTGTGVTELEKLILGGAVEVSTHAKLQLNGFARLGALLLYAQTGDDPLDALVNGSVKALQNREADNRLTWGGYPLWSDDAGGRSLPGISGAMWWRAPDGMIIQAAWPSAADGEIVNFPITFPNACNSVLLTENHPTAVLSICANAVTNSGYTFRAHNTSLNTTHNGASQHMMLAIGH